MNDDVELKILEIVQKKVFTIILVWLLMTKKIDKFLVAICNSFNSLL